jgi:hypothetical protein
MARPDELERRIRKRLNALGPTPRAELLHVLRLPDFDRADPETRDFGELLIDLEEDKAAREGHRNLRGMGVATRSPS